jgi:hypothetical protein
VALASYFFVVHLGYRALPFLKHTERYLYPVAVVGLGWATIVLLMLLGYRVNITRVRNTSFHVQWLIFKSFSFHFSYSLYVFEAHLLLFLPLSFVYFATGHGVVLFRQLGDL